MIYQTKEYMQFQAWHDSSTVITAGGMPLLLKDGRAFTPNNSYGGPPEQTIHDRAYYGGFSYTKFINDLKAIGAKEYLIRFSPWLNNHIDFPNATFSRHTVARDLTIPIKWGKGTKSSIKKNVDSGCHFIIIDDGIFIDHGYTYFFYNLYMKTMERNKSEECYKYSLDYFKKMLEYLNGNINLFFVLNNTNDPIAAATFLHDKYTVHYQFSGMDIEYAHLYPMERLISEACHYYQQQGKHLIHFGGGITEDDSLHRFKNKFGNLDFKYYTARGSV